VYESIDAKSIDPTNHSKNQSQDRYKIYNPTCI